MILCGTESFSVLETEMLKTLSSLQLLLITFKVLQEVRGALGSDSQQMVLGAVPVRTDLMVEIYF